MSGFADRTSLKCDLHSKIKPISTIGKPNKAHINSPVTEGDHFIKPAKEQAFSHITTLTFFEE